MKRRIIVLPKALAWGSIAVFLFAMTTLAQDNTTDEKGPVRREHTQVFEPQTPGGTAAVNIPDVPPVTPFPPTGEGQGWSGGDGRITTDVIYDGDSTTRLVDDESPPPPGGMDPEDMSKEGHEFGVEPEKPEKEESNAQPETHGSSCPLGGDR